MSVRRRSQSTPLTLVASPSPDVERGANGKRDWSRLMGRAQDGDRTAYRALLDDLTPYLRSLAVRCFKDPGDIEDVVQDVLLTIHVVRHAYDPARPFGPWVIAIARGRIVDKLRRDIRNKSREIAFDPSHETFSAHQSNLQAHLDDVISDAAALKAAIEQLPPDQRQAITLLKLKELSLREAALASGRSVAALKVATHRAIRSLRQMLERQDDRR